MYGNTVTRKISLILALSLLSFAPSALMAEPFEDSCGAIIASAGIQDDSERLKRLFTIAWDRRMDHFPEWASMIGYPGHDTQWTDNSLGAIERRKADNLLLKRVIESIPRDNLTDDDRLNYDLFNWRLDDEIDDAAFPDEYMQINQLGGVHQNVPELLSMMPTSSVAQYENIIARLRGVPEMVGKAIVLLKKGVETGVTPPQVTLREVPAQILSQISDNPADAPMLKPFSEFPATILSEERSRLKKEAYEVYERRIVPALKKLHSFVTKEYIPNCRTSIGASALPNGQAWYAHRVRHYTTTDMTPERIHQKGLDEVARIRKEMDRIIEQTEFNGSFADFCEFLRTDNSFYFTRKEDLLREYRDISKRADPELIKLFGHLPRLPYGVVPVPSYSEKSQTTAYYQPGSLKAGRPGNFYANTYDLTSRPKWEMEALTLHEAVPGHHLQGSIAQELDNLPEFRRFGWFTAFGEGWALYSESLGEEMGFYGDPYSKFGQLTYEMWRAIRLVVDVGMHSMGWSRQQAIDYFMENSCKTGHDVIVEVDRYIVWPGQALAYKIGELKIKELRKFAADELGEKFDIRAFHDEVLGNGALPLSVLETHIRDWVAEQKKG